MPSSQQEGQASAGLRGLEPSQVSQAICRGLDPLQRWPEPAQSPTGQQRALLWVPPHWPSNLSPEPRNLSPEPRKTPYLVTEQPP